MTTRARHPGPPSGRIAAVDVGTNTALLVVADFVHGRLVPVLELERFVRLGEGVDRSRTVRPEALARLAAALSEFRRRADELGATAGIVGATSASRDAANRAELVRVATEACGWPYEVLGGETEARLTFAGAVAAEETPGERVVLVDVGGGSTELVRGRPGPPGVVEVAGSADMGSVRVTERYFASVPPAAHDVERAIAACRGALAPVAGDVGRAPVVVGAGGTAVTLAAVAGAIGAPLSVEEVCAWRDRLLALTPREVLALDPTRLAGREDVFAAGVLVLHAALEAVGARTLVASPWGLRHGLALRAFGAA